MEIFRTYQRFLVPQPLETGVQRDWVWLNSKTNKTRLVALTVYSVVDGTLEG
jgi:hypothetical protein